MKNYKRYLTRRGYHPNSVKGYSNALQNFFNWCEAQSIKPRKVTLEQLYDYQSDLRNNGYAISTMRERIVAISHYYRHIRRTINPALLVKTEKQERRLPKGLIDEDLLLEMYLGVLPKSLTQQRNKCMLGFLIFQAVKRSELELLELEHIDFTNNRVLISGSTVTNDRYISIHPAQKRDLEEYVYQLRDQLVIEANYKKTSKLFFSLGVSSYIGNSLNLMIKDILLAYPYFRTLTQVRESRITIWVKKYGIRKAQYLSGIRYASSVLRYKRSNTEQLKQKIAIIHPMEKL